MKLLYNIGIYSAIALFAIACKKEFDDGEIFNQNSQTRIEEVNQGLIKTLSSSTSGWKVTIFPNGGELGGYNYWMKFDTSNRVTMTSEYSTDGTTPKTSSYIVKKLQEPSLVFDSYNYIHQISDPDASNNGGDYGGGLYSDFEFFVDSTFISEVQANVNLDTVSTIHMRGRYNSSEVLFERASTGEDSSYIKNVLTTKNALNDINNIQTYYKRIVLGNNRFNVLANTNLRTLTLSGLDDNGNSISYTSTYYIGDANNIVLRQPIGYNDDTLYELVNPKINATYDAITFTNEGKDREIEGQAQPLSLDPSIVAAFKEYTYYNSSNGLYVNGVADAYGLFKNTGLVYLQIYLPGYFGGTIGGFLLYTGSAWYGYYYGGATYTSDNRIVFGAPTTSRGVPTNMQTQYINTVRALIDTQGFYIDQLSDNSFVLVSAKDGKKWINISR